MARNSIAGNSLDLDAILEPDGLARDIGDQWESWDTDRRIAKDRWQEVGNFLYATSTRETPNDQNDWSHSTHIPKLTQIYDNLIANYMSALFPHSEWLKFVAENKEAASKNIREGVEAYIKTKHVQSNFKDDIQLLIQDWVQYGNCFASVSYVNESHTTPDGEQVQGYVGPRIYRISPLDIVFNPLASSFDKSPKIIRSLRSMGELHRMVEDNVEDREWAQEAIDKLKKFRSMSYEYSRAEIDKNTQLQFDGFGSISEYLESGFVEILQFYGDIYDRHEEKFYKNHSVTIVDRSWVLMSEPISNWTGHAHIYHCGWRPRPDNLWAMGPLDNLIGMQYLINHLENARADAFDQMLAPTRVIVGEVEEEEVVPGKPAGAYYIPSGEGSVQNLAPDTTVLNADNQIQLKEAEMEMFAGSPRETMGFRTPGEKTAFEVQTLMNAASRIFQSKIDYFETQFLEKIVNAEIEVARRNLNGNDIAQVMDNDLGVQSFLQVTPEMLSARGKIVPRGARHFARQNQLSQNLSQMMQAAAADPMLLQHFPSVKLAQAWENLLGFENLDLIQPYGRIPEQAEAQRRMNAAEQQVQVEDMDDLGASVANETNPNQNQQ